MRKKKYTISILLALLAGLLVSSIAFFAPDFYQTFEAKTLDMRFRLRGSIHQRSDIAFIEIDAPSLEMLGRWPWSRDRMAHITQVLRALSAKAILFDVIFSEISPLVIDKEKISQALAQSQPQALRDAVSLSLQDNDALLADAIQKAGNVYLGAHFDLYSSSTDVTRHARFEKLRIQFIDWIEQNPSTAFEDIPSVLTRASEFTQQEIKNLFMKLKLNYLFTRNIELPFKEVASFFPEEDEVALRQLFQTAKAQALHDRIEEEEKQEKNLSLEKLAGMLGIFNPQDALLLKNVYGQMRAEKLFCDKTGLNLQIPTGFYQAASSTFPIPELSSAMRSSGHLDAVTDSDGTLRSVPLFVRYNGKTYPHLAFRYVCDMLGIDIAKDVRIERGSIVAGKQRIPIDAHGCVLLNWAGKWQEAFTHVSAAQLHHLWELEQSVEPFDAAKRQNLRMNLEKQVKDKICVIGLTAAGTLDYKPIPLESSYPVVGTYATIINSVLEGKFLTRASSATNYALILACAVLVAGIASFLPVGMSFVCIAGMIAFYAIIAFLLFSRNGIWIDVTGPMASGFLSYISIVSYHFSVETKEKRWIKKVFSHYISKAVMEEVLLDPAKLALGGQTKEVTVLFSDIRGFTAYSEKHGPQEVVAILNEYLNEMSEIIFKHNGTLDKYVGDEIMAFFGAPVAQADHARRAVDVALEMRMCLMQLQEKRLGEDKETFDIGIGINTGPVVVGNMGSAERMNYTAIGDAVNVASRIQALTRVYQNHIIISESTYALVKEFFAVKPLEAFKLKGKENLVMLYEVVGYANAC